MRVVFHAFDDGTYHLFETDDDLQKRQTLEGAPPAKHVLRLIAAIEATFDDTDEAFQNIEFGFEKISSLISDGVVRGRRVVLHGFGTGKYHLFSTDLEGRDRRTLDGNPNAWREYKRIIAFLEAICDDSEDALQKLQEGLEQVRGVLLQRRLAVL